MDPAKGELAADCIMPLTLNSSCEAVYLALGVTADGTKDILGLWIEATEGAKFWLKVMNDLKARGVEDILVAVVDGLKGFPEAIEAVFPQTAVQTCIVHLIRNSLDFVSWKDRKPVVGELRKIYLRRGRRGRRRQPAFVGSAVRRAYAACRAGTAFAISVKNPPTRSRIRSLSLSSVATWYELLSHRRRMSSPRMAFTISIALAAGTI